MSPSEREFGPDHPTTAALLNNLAVLYRDQGRYAEAEPLFQRSLAIVEKSAGHEGQGNRDSARPGIH